LNIREPVNVMTTGDAITSHSTSALPPSQAELRPPPLKVDAQNASSEASMNAITAAAENKNTMNQIAGSVGGGKIRRTRRYRNRNSKSGFKRTKCTCKCKCKGCCLTRRLSRRRGLRVVLNKSQRRMISRRIQMNLLHRKIRKNKNANHQSQRGGDSAPALVPQHGASCASSAEQNCPGNSSASLLESSRQASMNAQGDQLE
jgi:hypothetical protein